MPKFQQYVRLAYFGYAVEFDTASNDDDAIRAEANAKVIAKFGAMPDMSYVEPGLPFPAYVPVQRWATEDGKFY